MRRPVLLPPRRWRSRPGLPTRWDLAVALTTAAAVAASGAFDLSTPRPSGLTVAFGFGSALALLARTSRPVATLAVVTLFGIVPTMIAGTDPDFYCSFVPAMVAVYAVAVRCPSRRAASVPVAGAVVLVSFAARVPSFMNPAQVIFIVAGLGFAFAAGRTMRVLRRRADIESARADLLEREQHLQAREAVVAERERIARELHDVVAHDVSVMVIHAGAAQRLLPENSARAAESLAQIQASGRKAIDELHLLLGMLRNEQPETVAQPGLHAVGQLVDELAAVGLPVSLDVSGPVRDIGAALDVSAYRLVQEALTNVLKHAAGARTQVALDYGPAALTILVTDNGAGDDEHIGTGAGQLPSSGRGLVGMRERVRLFGGTLTSGAQPAGGWAVTAVLPIPAALV